MPSRRTISRAPLLAQPASVSADEYRRVFTYGAGETTRVARGTQGTREARRRRKTTRARNREAIATYRASLAVAGLLVGLLVFLVILTIQRDTLTPALDDLAAHPTTPSRETVTALGLFFGLPLAAALGSGLGLAVLIAWMRLWIYVRGVRRHTRRYLRIHLPPGAAPVRPHARRRDDRGASSGGEALALDALFKTSRRVMLLGEAGAGKTVALHQIARRLTRRRMLPLVFLGLAPLPILLQLASYPFQDGEDGELGEGQKRAGHNRACAGWSC